MIKRVDKRLQAVQCLTGNKIKIIACITMLIDHFSKIFLESIMNDKLFPLYLAGGMSTEQFYGIDAFQKNILNGIGTIAFPLFCLLLSEGFFYTKNRKRYIGGMLAFALISEVPFDIGFFSRYSIAEGTFPFYLQYQNVFFTLFLGLLTLVIIEKVALKISGDGRKSKVTKILCQLGVVIIMAIIAEAEKGPARECEAAESGGEGQARSGRDTTRKDADRGRQGCDGGAGEGAEGGGDPGCGGRAEGAGAEGRKPTASAENPLDERKAEGGPGAEAA